MTREPARKFKRDGKKAKRLGKRKVDSECRVFNQKWTSDYFLFSAKKWLFVSSVKKQCLCSKNTTCADHHREKYASLQGQMRADKVSKLKSVLSTQQNMFVRQTQLNQSSVRASFQVAKLIATSGRPFSDGEFVKKCMNAVAEEVCPYKKTS